MQMDINDFGMHQEMFGFGGNDIFQGRSSYQQMSRSNTNFLNFTSAESRRAKSIKDDYFKRIDALPATDQAGRNALFAELEAKLNQMSASTADVADVQTARNKSQRGENISVGLKNVLNIFNKVTDALGIGKDVGGDSGSGQNQGQGGGGGTQPDNKMPIWPYIVGGVVVLGLGIFAIYKFRK